MESTEKTKLIDLLDRTRAYAETAAFGNIGRRALERAQYRSARELANFARDGESISPDALNVLDIAAGIVEDLLWALHDLRASADIYNRVKRTISLIESL